MHLSLLRPFVVLCSLLLYAPSALAYVRTITSTDLPIAWKNPCIQIHIYLASPPPLLSADKYFEAAQKAAAVWSHDELACSDVRLTMVKETVPNPIARNDGINMIIFRQDSWCPSSGKIGCFSPNALALTSTWKNTKTGEIPDADIQINAVKTETGNTYQWNDIVTNPGKGLDFQNMLTHELGHVLGLAHNCYTTSDDPPSTKDHMGNDTADCYSDGRLTEEVTAATMFPSVDRNDFSRRTLTQDDQDGICAIYPFTHTTCPSSDTSADTSSDTSGGCQLTPRPDKSAPTDTSRLVLVFLGFSAALFLLRRHYRQRG